MGGGELIYSIYRALTYGLTPLINLHLRWRKFRGLEHHLRWRERLGVPSLPRPPGPLLWFHAVSLGEGMAAIPVINRCVQRRPDVNILMTTTAASALQSASQQEVGEHVQNEAILQFLSPICRRILLLETPHPQATTCIITLGSDVLKNLLPGGVVYQFAPLDTPSAVDAFLGYWKPNAIVIMENEMWPNLVIGASRNGIMLALLNGRMSTKSFNNWSGPVVSPLISLMLSKFSLIVPLSTLQAIRFQLLQAPPFVINFSGDLKYGIEEFYCTKGDTSNLKDLQLQLAYRPVWLASSIHSGEEKVILEAHKTLKQMHPDMVTIIVPRHPQLGREIAHELQREGVSVALRSRGDTLMPGTSIYVVDTLGELRNFYRLVPIAVIGGSLLSGLTGHNISEAAAAGCAVLTGPHLGHFSHMAMAMRQLNPSSVQQVTGRQELEEVLHLLLSNPQVLEDRRAAAKEAFRALSNGVVENVWKLLSLHVFSKNLKETKACE